MKKFKYILMGAAAVLLSACSADMGTEPGTDAEPVVTMFSYAPDVKSGMNADNDVIVRFATNSATKEVYYLVELENDVKAFIEANGTEAYMQKVIANGTKFETNGAANIDENITDIHGAYTITGVAVNGGTHTMATVSFLGLDWNTLKTGVFSPGSSSLPSAFNAAIEICTTDENLYRIKDAVGAGYNIKFTLMDKKYSGVDEMGPYRYVRIAEQSTPWVVAGMPLLVGDVATWQEDSSFALDDNYCSVMYTNDYFCWFCLAWYISDGRALSYGDAYFEAN